MKPTINVAVANGTAQLTPDTTSLTSVVRKPALATAARAD
jgi:hypothetical protein